MHLKNYGWPTGTSKTDTLQLLKGGNGVWKVAKKKKL